jgi:hypothetical protein
MRLGTVKSRQPARSRAADYPPRPRSGCAGLSLYRVVRNLQALLATWTGTCIVCGQRIPSHARAPT